MMKLDKMIGLTLLFSGGMANAAVTITEIDLANNRVELVNTGTSSIDLTNYWWCNLVTGSPAYRQIGDVSTLDAALSTGTIDVFGAGDILVLNIAASFLTDDDGELGIYNTNSFSSSAAIEDYVAWGADGIRDSVGAAAGIWAAGTFVDVAGIAAGQTIQLTQGAAGNVASEYFIAESSLGAIPEPSSTLLVAVSALGLGLRWRRK